MKLRIRGNSLRLRLSRSEVIALGRGDSVVETVTFSHLQTLQYQLEANPEASQINATYDGHKIIVQIPRSSAIQWSLSNQIALKHQQNLDCGNLKILIEKDFACLKPRENENEDESDLFPNPNLAHRSCGGPNS